MLETYLVINLAIHFMSTIKLEKKKKIQKNLCNFLIARQESKEEIS